MLIISDLMPFQHNYNNIDPMKYFIKYVGIGGLSTLIQFALLILLVKVAQMPEVPASATSYALSSIFNYLANYHYTFASSSSHAKTLPKFVLAVALGLGANTLLFAVFFKVFGHYLLAQLLATGITVFLNFLVHKLWIYKGHHHEQ